MVSLWGATSQRRFASRLNLRKEHGSLSFRFQFSLKRSSRVWVGGLVAAVALLALNNRAATKQALSLRAKGRTIEVDGVRLRYVEAGSGRDLVLLHGNGSAAEDFQTSGLVDKAAKRYRVIVFDRPGFGGSTRPRDRLWTAAAQADLLQSATQRIGADNPIVLGHSWGASVALQWAARYPDEIGGAVLLSGYHFPSPRFDALLAALPALPIVGTIICHTVLPPVVRLIWPVLMRRLFRPQLVPPEFSEALRGLVTAPSHLRTTAAESGLLIPVAASAPKTAGRTNAPIGIMAGEADSLLDTSYHSQRLHRALPGSMIRIVAGAGHMVHHAAPHLVLEMVDNIAAAGSPSPEKASHSAPDSSGSLEPERPIDLF
ncbi:alpha/beta hydrolase [Mesorhizobium sp. B2-6-4]|nr:alpha/beta hydrolase [Mesorhizobium sp. B2-6-4]